MCGGGAEPSHGMGLCQVWMTSLVEYSEKIPERLLLACIVSVLQ